MGPNQVEIATKVDEIVGLREFDSAAEFETIETELINQACKELGWSAVPSCGGLIPNWDYATAIKLVSAKAGEVVVEYNGNKHRLLTGLDDDNNITLKHYHGYCAVTSDLLTEFNNDFDDSEELENALRKIIDGARLKK